MQLLYYILCLLFGDNFDWVWQNRLLGNYDSTMTWLSLRWHNFPDILGWGSLDYYVRLAALKKLAYFQLIHTHICFHNHLTCWNTVVIPCACARGKVIGFVVVVVVVDIVSTKIAKSQKIGVWQSALCHQTVESHEKLCSVRFKSLRKAHEHYKSCVFTGHAYRPHLAMHMHVHVLFPLCMLDFYRYGSSGNKVYIYIYYYA